MRSKISEVALVRHPACSGDAVRGVAAKVSRPRHELMAITYSIEGDTARMRVPPPQLPRIMHGLWRHTCCECFVAQDDRPEYLEFNFAPSGEWAVYAFAEYREGVALDDQTLNPGIAVRRFPDRLELDASIRLHRLSEARRPGRVVLALSTVIEDTDGVVSYWALTHPPGKPDFHHRSSFMLEIE